MEERRVCRRCLRQAVEFPPRNPGFHFRLIASVYFCFLLPAHYFLGCLYYSAVLLAIYGSGRISIGAYCRCFNGRSALLALLDVVVAGVTVLYATVSRSFLVLAADEVLSQLRAAMNTTVT